MEWCATLICAVLLQGFLVNRVLIPMINEAFFCLMEVCGHKLKQQLHC